jgi:ribosomal protein L9
MTETNVGVLEILADPALLNARASELLEAAKQAELVQQKAIAAKIEADQAFKAAADEVTKQRELQAINTGKSAKLTEEKAALADKLASHEINKADDVKRLGEWEARLKAQHDAQAEVQAEIDRQVNELAAGRAKLDADLAAAEEIFAKAEAVRSAMG